MQGRGRHYARRGKGPIGAAKRLNLYIHIYYILYDGGRCMRDVRARSGIYFDEHRAGSKEATTLCRLF